MAPRSIRGYGAEVSDRRRTARRRYASFRSTRQCCSSVAPQSGPTLAFERAARHARHSHAAPSRDTYDYVARLTALDAQPIRTAVAHAPRKTRGLRPSTTRTPSQCIKQHHQSRIAGRWRAWGRPQHARNTAERPQKRTRANATSPGRLSSAHGTMTPNVRDYMSEGGSAPVGECWMLPAENTGSQHCTRWRALPSQLLRAKRT